MGAFDSFFGGNFILATRSSHSEAEVITMSKKKNSKKRSEIEVSRESGLSGLGHGDGVVVLSAWGM